MFSSVINFFKKCTHKNSSAYKNTKVASTQATIVIPPKNPEFICYNCGKEGNNCYTMVNRVYCSGYCAIQQHGC
jgi:hypothetical protein